MINVIDRIETKLGPIRVLYSDYRNGHYPGYWVQLAKDGRELVSVLFEVDETDEDPKCKIKVWDTTQDEPVCDLHGCCHNNEMKLEYCE